MIPLDRRQNLQLAPLSLSSRTYILSGEDTYPGLQQSLSVQASPDTPTLFHFVPQTTHQLLILSSTFL